MESGVAHLNCILQLFLPGTSAVSNDILNPLGQTAWQLNVIKWLSLCYMEQKIYRLIPADIYDRQNCEI